ncbi:MAG: bifunctional aspartate kinase/homoserine dehydrogenase I [Sphaerochaetaceae bacterium]|nr:bifunctional aspartate kinase/homoserine dehydrogenase I [Sphaerochaetaceae bacterium]
MENARIHALEGAMISSREGLEKLMKIASSSMEEAQVFVLSPIHSGPLCFEGLLSSAKAHEERLWGLLEHSQETWFDLVAECGCDKDEQVNRTMRKGFEDMEDILRSVWLLGSISHATHDFFAGLTSGFLSLLAASYAAGKGKKCNIMYAESAIESTKFSSGITFVCGKLIQPKSVKLKDFEGEGEYTAALIAAKCSGALTYWNNRSLLCSARKKDIPTAQVIRTMTFAEATELSFFGAPIVHPHFFIPAQSAEIDVQLKYWGEIENDGTTITSTIPRSLKRSTPVKAFSVMRDIAIINIEGAGMSGIPGISSRLFTALRMNDISVILISQASSEYSICFAVPSDQVLEAQKCAKEEFSSELDSHQIASITVANNFAIIAAVGEEMTGYIGVSGMFFSALARAGVNVSVIAQGSSERNISAVIREKDSIRALTALHAAFFLSEQTLSVGLFGPGNIGGTLLDQIRDERQRLKRQFDIDIRIRGIANSRKMLLSEEGVDLNHWRELFEKNAVPVDMKTFLNHVGAEYYPHAAIVDCTTSPVLAGQYVELLDRFHVITPNKKAATGTYEYYKAIMEKTKRSGKRFLYETTVGAGLPVINTLNDLIQTGDEIFKIEGMVSGTLAWLFSKYDGNTPFSELVYEAKRLGYTEPDPRDDLSGMDVARKTVILARETGLDVELSDLKITSLVPDSLKNESKEEFLKRLPEMDEDMKRRYEDAKSRGKVLRYVGKVDHGKCAVALEECPLDHPFAQAQGTDNVIAFTTKRYHEGQPLVVKGPGAGPDVTAGGVFSDLLRLSVYLGAGLI